MCETLKEANQVLTGGLILGNQDSLMTYGSEVQSEIRALSKSILEISLRSNVAIEELLDNILYEINCFEEVKAENSVFHFWKSKEKQRRDFIGKYKSIFAYMDKMVLGLQLQQAELLKEVKIIEQLLKKIDICMEDIEKYIQTGRDTLDSIREKSSVEIVNDDDTDKELWIRRLERKIEDLNTSKIVALQNKAQMSLIIDNNVQLIDRIVSATSIIIPLWQNQVSMILGIEKSKRVLSINEKILNATGKNVTDLQSKKEAIDKDSLYLMNKGLKSELKMITEMEKKDTGIRKKISTLMRA